MAKKKTFGDALSYLRAFFVAAPYGDRKRLWAVLTAMRGPDYENGEQYDDKISTTAVIRRAAFGADALADSGSIVRRDSRDAVKRRRAMEASYADPDDRRHFYDHARAAFDSLGLKWNELNK